MEKKRNTGLDVCRTAAMAGIIMIHIIRAGGVLPTGLQHYNSAAWVTEFTRICVLCSVNLFGILTGYFGIRKTGGTLGKAAELILTVLFYSTVITILFRCFMPGVYHGPKDYIAGIIPALKNRYWYITNYIPLLLLRPLINPLLLHLSLKRHRQLIGFILIVFCLIPSACSTDLFLFKDGKSFVWLVCCYIFGAYAGRAEFTVKKRSRLAGYYLLPAVLLLVINIGIEAITGKHRNYMVTYISPLIAAMSFAAFLFFKDTAMGGKQEALWRGLASTAFDVYIIHAHIMIYDYVLTDSFRWIRDLHPALIPITIMGTAAGIYGVCALIGMLRKALFRALHTDRLCRKLDTFAEFKMQWNRS